PSDDLADLKSLEKSLRAPASEEELRHAYAGARARVAQLARQHGKAALLDWVQNGLPAELTASATAQRSGAAELGGTPLIGMMSGSSFSTRVPTINNSAAHAVIKIT